MKTQIYRSGCLGLLSNALLVSLLLPDTGYAHGGRYYGRYSGGYSRYGSYCRIPYRSYRSRTYSINTKPAYTTRYVSPEVVTVLQAQGGGYHANIDFAWSALTQGEYLTALQSFAIAAESQPQSGGPKTGYSLASASTGNLQKGVWAMRRALRIDSEALLQLQLTDNVNRLIAQLIDQYNAQAYHDQADAAFMVSALHYLQQNYQAAKQALVQAEQLGDESASFRQLQRLVALHENEAQ